MNRRDILDGNRAMREKRAPGPRRLDDGEVAFRIPQQDYKVLTRLYPGLVSKDHSERMAAWRSLRHSPVGAQYLVQRTPAQVKKSPGGIIIK